MKSILQAEKACYLCGREWGLECHHIFAGGLRKVSERNGLKVWLCHECHTGKHGAQYDPIKNRTLKADAQREYERTHSLEDWMRIVGKNYL